MTNGQVAFACVRARNLLVQEAQSELHYAWAADLEERTQLADHIAGTEAGGKHLGGGAEARAWNQSKLPGNIRITRIGEVRMIEDVERFRAELQVQAPG